MAGKNSFIALNVQGWKDLEKALRDLGDDAQIKKAMKTALSDAGEIIARDARSRVRKKHGGLQESIDVRPTLSPRQKRERTGGLRGPGTAEIFVGPTWPDGAHGVLVEFGTAVRHHKNGAIVGAMPPFPFMRPAWEAGKARVLNEFGARLGLEIERAATRIARKQARLIAQGRAG
jgi:HK97 gp10 family phage protein